MSLAYCILAHTDIAHITRPTFRLLGSGADVYIHFDANADDSGLRESLRTPLAEGRAVLLENRLHCAWGGWNAVAAEIELLRTALERQNYDRLVFLQGLDYPLKSDSEILAFFEQNPTVEFIRGCNCSRSENPYFREKCRCFWNHNAKSSMIKKLTNGINRYLHPYLRSGRILCSGREYEVYWGSAQWALTGGCARYVVDWYTAHPEFNRWFYHAFPADEMYFQTVIFLSPYREKTMAQGPEPEQPGLTNWRALHYFEYGRTIKVMKQEDLPLLEKTNALYVRKVTTAESTALLDLLDSRNQEAASCES